MFCKNCGSDIKDGIKFCPKCGKAAAGSGSFSAEGSRKNMWIILAAAAVAVVAALAIWYYNESREYSIVGEWESTDLVDMQELIDGVIEEKDFSGWQAGLIRTALAPWYDMSDNLTIVFYERGDFGITVGGVGVAVFETTYEQMSNRKLNLNFGLTGILKQIPVSELSYNVKCRVRKNKMTLELFGQELNFRRK